VGLLATGGYDKAVKVWDLRSTKEPVVTWRKAHEDWVSAVHVDVSGEKLLSASFDGTVKVHKLVGKQAMDAVAANAAKWRNRDSGGVPSLQEQAVQLQHHGASFGYSYNTPAVEHVLKRPASASIHAMLCTDHSLLAVGAGASLTKWAVRLASHSSF
jgi:WD40 repeat protein